MNHRFLIGLLVFIGGLLLLVLDPVEAGRKRSRNNPRNRKQKRSRNDDNNNAPCEPKYMGLSPHHTRCLQADGSARLKVATRKQKEYILKLHNNIRARETPTASDMIRLVWDDSLALTAEKWAMQCKVAHDGMKERSEPDWPLVKIGQNIGTGHKNFRVMINRMYSEKERYNFTYGDAFVPGIGHYYQLVSAQTSRVGCAKALCPHRAFKRIRVCNYAPAFDASRPPYNRGNPCGDCPGHCDASGKLCDCGGKLCYNGGRLDPNTCRCVCQSGWTGDHCETLDCDHEDPVPECKNGQLRAEDCEQPGTAVQDPNMCPHLCGLCPQVCDGLECKNGGKLNAETCRCDCPGLLTGDTCEKCPARDESYCTRYQERGRECGSLVAADCPILCGKCNTTCPLCENLGELNSEDCTCTCLGKFTGPRCEICPSDDELHCTYYSVEMCADPGLRAVLHITCPYRCGVCQNIP